MFVSGVADGTSEVLRYHYEGFKNRFPDARDTFWQPSQSWPNKWKNGDPTQGPAYFGSTTFLVWTTDGFHLCRTIRNVHMIAALAIPIGYNKKWYFYIVDAIVYYISYTAGFTLSYDLIFWNYEWFHNNNFNDFYDNCVDFLCRATYKYMDTFVRKLYAINLASKNRNAQIISRC